MRRDEERGGEMRRDCELRLRDGHNRIAGIYLRPNHKLTTTIQDKLNDAAS